MPAQRNRFQKVLGERNDRFLAVRGGRVRPGGAERFLRCDRVRPGQGPSHPPRRVGPEGSAAARRAKRLVEHLDEYLSATQLGITLASLALGWIGEPAFAHLIEPLGTWAGLAPTTREGIAAALSFLLITFLHIVFGELAPKSLAIQRSEGTALVVSAPMRWFRLLFYPAIWALNGVAAATLRVVGLRPPSDSEANRRSVAAATPL